VGVLFAMRAPARRLVIETRNAEEHD
jgi:hypothetical protein